jgi:hypothetical protein
MPRSRPRGPERTDIIRAGTSAELARPQDASQHDRRSASGLAVVSSVSTREPRTRDVIDEWMPRLECSRAVWADTLPAEAATIWARGAVYVRQSSARSLVGEAADVQLRGTLAQMAQKKIFVPPEGIFFDVESGTDIGPRAAFQRLFEEALRGGFKAIGVYVNERLFRNLEQAIQIKRQFRLHGIDVIYLGKWEGDPRNPAAWQLEVMQDMNAELHARNTSHYVGLHHEALTRAGRPVGRLPEVYRPAERAPTFLGRRGSVISWEIVQPLGSIMQEGLRRYKDGATFSDLAAWSATTELKGVTPQGRVMNTKWWYHALTNPKFAGYQMPTTYMGFKPGKESPGRPRRNAKSELVPCLLPPLWTLDDHREVYRLARTRWRGAKDRRTFRSYLLSGIAYDATCGHKLAVCGWQAKSPERFSIRCGVREIGGAHSPAMRADLAERELDELLGHLSFDDEELNREIERELRRLAEADGQDRRLFLANPVIASVRQALAALGKTGMDDIRADLERRLVELEEADVARRDALSVPLLDFRRALARLKDWSEVWAEADTRTKNKLLREGGVRVVVGKFEGETRRPAHVLAISVENPAMELALVTALARYNKALGRQQSYGRPNAHIELRIQGDLADVIAGSRASQECVPLLRPRVMDNTPWNPSSMPGGPWVGIREFIAATGMKDHRVRALAAAGSIAAVRARHGGRAWWLIEESELERWSTHARARKAA